MENFDFINAFLKAGIINKVIFILLIIMSVYVWSLIIKKHIEFKKANALLNNFLNNVNNGDVSRINSYIFAYNNYYADVLKVILQASESSNVDYNKIKLESVITLKPITKKIENKIANLASIANAAPFIGLLGTVLGVIASFQQIASYDSVSLDVIAPGIAEALYATALGIFVAVPSAIFYNLFNSKLEKLQDEHDDIINQLIYL